MDKSWINILNRNDPLYEIGAKEFIKFASLDRPNASEILCPCRKCRNMKFVSKDLIVEHIVVDGFLTSYTTWIFHGEISYSSMSTNQSDKGDEIHALVHDAFGVPPTSDFVDMDTSSDGFGGSDQHRKGFDKKTETFFNLLKEAECELYPGSKYSLLSFLVRLLHLKCLNGWSNNSFSMLLELLKDVFPEGEVLPKSFNDAKKIIKDLGLEYKKIHACPNDCMIYWNETKDRTNCKFCKTPRYKQFKGESSNSMETSKIPAKVFRYFPLIPRLQRLFMSSKTSTQMRWHAEGRTRDGVMRHPADSIAWKNFDELHPSFSQDPRNVRLGLASDGFNPFKSMSISHSTWPVVLVPYNLPPWLCKKQPYMILSMIIDGPRAPGNDIDVYLRPLIYELKELWVGVDTYDVSNNHMFQMRASLLWTISDFPALGNLSGYGVKTRYACPCCLTKTKFLRLRNGRKYCFMSHRRWLPHGHKFRKDKVTFNGFKELEVAPKRLSGIEVLEQLKGIKNNFGKGPSTKSNKRKWNDFDNVDDALLQNVWKKKSIFFELDYWKDNMIRHNLDSMHIEKNVFDNIFWTLLNIDGKGKDNLNSRLDLQEMGIRKALHPKKRANGKYYLPPACFTLSNAQKEMLLQVIRDVKVPDGYASNISRCVNIKQRTMHGLKSHDCHILMQQLLPFALRDLLPMNVLKPLIELSNFFRGICSTSMSTGDLEKLQDRVAITLCHLERIFLPSFFDIMEHLVIHLAEEAMIGGPSQYRSMWPFERYLLTLKNYVRSKSCPEGSIAEGYWIEECMTFCSRYLHDVETKLSRPLRNCAPSNEAANQEGRRSSKEIGFRLDDITHAQAHIYVLFNSASTTPYRDEHIKEIKKGNPRLSRHQVDRIHNEKISIWFRKHVEKLHMAGEQISEEIQYLAIGPSKQAKRMTGYISNGIRYLTKSRDAQRKIQNSGIMVKATTQSYASARDKNPILAEISFYGVLTSIIELYYSKKFKFVLFGCQWVDNNKGLIEKDDYGFTLVNFNHLLYTRHQLSNEPFIFASQAQQVFYVHHPMAEEWQIVVKLKPRGFYDLGENTQATGHMDGHMELWPEQQLDDTTFESEEDIEWVREGVPGTEIDPQTMESTEAFDEDYDIS